jgi:hypothetical protein
MVENRRRINGVAPAQTTPTREKFMQQIWLALIIGLIIGWIIEWLIDWRYWRKSIAALRAENAELRRQLAASAVAESAPNPPVSPSDRAATTHQVE